MISPLAVVETRDIGADVEIGEFAIVREGAVLGDGVRVHPHAVIGTGVVLEAGVEVFPGAVVGKEPRGAGAVARAPRFEKRVVVGAGSSISPHAVVFYDVTIGRNTLIGDGASIREGCTIGAECIVSRYVTVNYNSRIGDRTKIMDLTHVTGNCEIGSDVFVSILVGMVNDNALGAEGYDEERIIGPRIRDGAMVGAGAMLLPGVTIGEGAVIGAGAVVTRDVDPRTVMMGMPARSVRSLDAARGPSAEA